MLLVGGKWPMVGEGGRPRRRHHFQGLMMIKMIKIIINDDGKAAHALCECFLKKQERIGCYSKAQQIKK